MIPGFNKLLDFQNKIKVDKKPKIFCIGLNKTGTTSLNMAMEEFGYVSGNQHKGEKLLYAWAKRDFEKIVHHCYSAQFFQDIPFSLPYTYISLDQAFPGSKFILTVRDSPEDWYKSLTAFHAKLWGKDRRIPTKDDLKNSYYSKKGWAWEANRIIYNTPEMEPYNKVQLIDHYNQHNKSVIEYFRHRAGDLLILNVADKKAYAELCKFLDIDIEEKEFPWENKT